VSLSAEDELVQKLGALFAQNGKKEGISIGIGDDCAVLDPGSAKLVWTVDAQIDGVHFRRDWLSLDDIGYRSFAAATSDVLAMGARPVSALSSLTLDPSFDDAALLALARGQAEAAEEAGAPIVGGNLARSSSFSITTTVLGRLDGPPVTREGAREGHLVMVSGPLGLAKLGLEAFVRGSSTQPALAPCVQAFRRPKLRFDRSLEGASAAMDVSDGLARDLFRLAHASRARIRISGRALLEASGDALLAGAAALGEDPVRMAFEGGEDYVLLVCAPRLLPGFFQVGEVLEGEGVELDGLPCSPGGHDHFAGRRASLDRA
jgi:thiamine-monophosphate kinase